MSTAYQLTPFMIVYAVVFSLSFSLCIYAVVRYLRHDRRPMILAFAVLTLGISSWELGNFLIDAVTAEQMKLLGKNVVNAVSFPVLTYALLALSLAYTGREQWLGGLAIICAVTVAGLSTALFVAPELLYESQGLATQGPFTVAGFTFEQFVTLDRTLTPAFSLFWAYGFLLGLIAIVILLRYVLSTSQDINRAQAGAMVVGFGAPLGASVLFISGVVAPSWNPTDISFGVSAVALAVAVFRYRMFRLVPVGRQQLVRIMDDPVILIDDDDRVVDSNPRARAVFGVESNWRGMTAATFFGPLAEQVTGSHDIDDADTETVVERGENNRYFDLRTTPVWTPGGEVGGRLVVLRDITELIEGREKIKQQNERLNEFAGVVAHDLRNPLNVAMGRAELLPKGESAEHIDAIARALERMDKLIQDLLQLARAATTVSDEERVNLEDVATAAWAYTSTAEATLTVTEAVPTVPGNRSRFTQLFENLFTNCIEHGGKDVWVTVGNLKHDAGFYVEDDGDGIPPEIREKVFDYGVTSSEDGTGFGLSIVADIAEAHDWSVRVTDGSDGGARFEFVVPE